jgi:hypothetical protein
MTKQELDGAQERITKGEELVVTIEDLAENLETWMEEAMLSVRNAEIEMDGNKLFEGGEPVYVFDFSPEITTFKNAVAKKVQKTIDKLQKEFDKL